MPVPNLAPPPIPALSRLRAWHLGEHRAEGTLAVTQGIFVANQGVKSG